MTIFKLLLQFFPLLTAVTLFHAESQICSIYARDPLEITHPAHKNCITGSHAHPTTSNPAQTVLSTQDFGFLATRR